MSGIIDREEKFAWFTGDVIVTDDDWMLTFDFDGIVTLVWSEPQLQKYLEQTDPSYFVNPTASFNRFLRFNPFAPFIPDHIRRQLQAKGLLPPTPQ